VRGGELVGEEAGPDVGVVEQIGVAVLDDDGGPVEGGEFGEGVGELAVDEAAGEVVDAFAFDDGDDLVVEGDAVVADGQGAAFGGGVLAGESVGVALSGVDELWRPSRPAGRPVGSRWVGRALRVVRADCQKMPSRPPLRRVKTSWERFSRARSNTRSMATPRRTQERTGTSSTITASAGQSLVRWQ
jgi:hypothetical protein